MFKKITIAAIFALWSIGSALLGQFFTNIGFVESSAFAADSKAVIVSENSKRSRVVALGRIEPQSEVIALTSMKDEPVSALFVEEGVRVNKGQILANLASYNAALAHEQHVSAKLTQAQAHLKADTNYLTALVHEAEIKLSKAEQLTPLKIKTQQARIDTSLSELTINKKELNRRKQLERSMLPETEYDRQALLVTKTEGILGISSSEIEVVKMTAAFDIKLAKATLQIRQADLDRAQLKAPIDVLTRELALARAHVKEATLVAPIAGKILKIIARVGEKPGAGAILQMGDVDVMYVVAEVYETDIQFVNIGQTATIKSLAFAQTLKGRVERIGSQIYKNDILNIDPAADTDARVVEVRIRLDTSEQAKDLSNLQVDVEIDVTKH